MRSIFFVLYMVLRSIGSLIRDFFSMFMTAVPKFVPLVVGYVDAQVDGIRYVFAKKACSATGGCA
jgi:hypothetical protein